MKKCFCFFLLVLSASVSADTFHEVVGFQCDKTKNVIVIDHHGAYNEEGEKLVEGMTKNQWDLWSLFEKNKIVNKVCVLSDGEYKVDISIYRRGSCHACPGIQVKVTKENQIVFNEELSGYGPGNNKDITQVIIKSHDEKPEITSVMSDGNRY